MREPEALEESLVSLDEALRGCELILDGDDDCPLDPQLFESLDAEIAQELELLPWSLSESQGSKHRPKPTRSRAKNYNQNKAREQRQAELVELRAEVEDLQFTLKRLEEIVDCARGPGRKQEKEKKTDRKSVWKDACVRQLQRRLGVEREKRHLMKRVEKEKGFIKNMQKLLATRPAMWEMAYPGTRKHTRRIEIPAGYMREMADFIFDELAAGVEASYREVEGLDSAISPLLARLPTSTEAKWTA
ncbi:ABC Superfamily [Phytophthora cinnamomi]|uniref:ABC Superfamily n=1 Tax=Phytophthora cinnamomi TaxID=4785 RepID=UPI0035598C29|nr:ABC Superfamily [Phytophthora cinnamomi]